MAKAKPISATMAIALGEMMDHGGVLVRWSGGFWTYPNCASKLQSWPLKYRVPDWYVSAGTIKALIDRGLLMVLEKHNGGWPIKVGLRETKDES